MKLRVERFSPEEDDTIGKLFINEEFQCFTLEDEIRAEKVKGETCIPSGKYKIKFREVLSGLTQSYRKRFPWFTWHLEVQNVPGFKYIYIHAGNTEDHSDGCLLLGKRIGSLEGKRAVLDSAVAFREVYEIISAVLEAGEDVEIFYHTNPDVR